MQLGLRSQSAASTRAGSQRTSRSVTVGFLALVTLALFVAVVIAPPTAASVVHALEQPRRFVRRIEQRTADPSPEPQERGVDRADLDLLLHHTKHIGLRYGSQAASKRDEESLGTNVVVNPELDTTRPSLVLCDEKEHSTTIERRSRRRGSSRVVTLPLTNVYRAGMDQEYLATVSLGTPGSTFRMSVDSGSSDTWVVSSSCSSGASCGASRRRYDATRSSSYRDLQRSFKLAYGMGSVAGGLMRDLVKLGSSMQITTTLGLVTRLSSDWADSPADGLMGLGFRRITAARTVPVFQNLIKQGQLEENMISFTFGRGRDGNGDRSAMVLGGVDEERIVNGRDGIKWYPLDRAGYWEIQVRGLGTSSSSPSRSGGGGTPAIIDTGTSLLALPPSAASEFWSHIPNATLHASKSFYTFPCEAKVGAYLEMSDGKRWKIDEKDLNAGSVGGGRCVGGVVPAETGGRIVLGLAFLKNVVTVLDRGLEGKGVRVGFGRVRW